VSVNDLPVKLDTIGTFNDVSYYYREGSKWTAKDQYDLGVKSPSDPNN
jgi:hypothetical protein